MDITGAGLPWWLHEHCSGADWGVCQWTGGVYELCHKLFSSAKIWLLGVSFFHVSGVASWNSYFVAVEEQVWGRLHQGQQRPLHLHCAQAVDCSWGTTLKFKMSCFYPSHLFSVNCVDCSEGQLQVENVLHFALSFVQGEGEGVFSLFLVLI